MTRSRSTSNDVSSLKSSSTSVVNGDGTVHHLQSKNKRSTGETVLPSLASTLSASVKQVHWIVLVHGWLGKPAEMNALRDSLSRECAARKTTSPSKTSACVIHCAVSNDGRTSDGVAAGGSRLATEINDLLTQTQHLLERNNYNRLQSSSDESKITLSIVGNSLGGLYGRYALAEIHVPYQPEVFCTTATPHVGVGHGNTYLRLPRFLERGIAFVLGRTGRDLFLTDDTRRARKHGRSTLLHELTFAPKYIHPLRRFRRRIAYANAYGTDFQVPTATAAFLTNSSSPNLSTSSTHTVLQTADHDDTGMIILVAETTSSAASSANTHILSKSHTISDLATTLDELGWTKVFCDMRQHLPNVRVWPRGSRDTRLTLNVGTQVTSQELNQEFASSLWSVENGVRWYFPFGHSMMVANSKSDWYARINAPGKPVMDRLARDILNVLLEENEH